MSTEFLSFVLDVISDTGLSPGHAALALRLVLLACAPPAVPMTMTEIGERIGRNASRARALLAELQGCRLIQRVHAPGHNAPVRISLEPLYAEYARRHAQR